MVETSAGIQAHNTDSISIQGIEIFYIAFKGAQRYSSSTVFSLCFILTVFSLLSALVIFKCAVKK